MSVSPSPTREAALEKLAEFLPRAGRAYSRERNFDYGPNARSNVSQLSPYLRYRLLSEEEVVGEVLKHHSLSDAAFFIQEVIWRSYWKGWLELHPEVWLDYLARLRSAHQALHVEESMSAKYNAALAAETGIECFDFWVKELRETGYLHNHSRMWFASIWIFTLKLPWALGAEFFYQHLLDGDPASNTLSWRWVAGLQTKGKHYLARAENIRKFTDGRFNPVGQLEENAEPLPFEEFGSASHQNLSMQTALDPLGLGRVGMILHDEDLTAENSPVGLVDGVIPKLHSIAFVSQLDLPNEPRLSEKVKNFVEGAGSDALSRAFRHYSLSPEVRRQEIEATLDLSDWVRRNELTHVVTMRPHVGPTRDLLESIKFGSDSIRLSYFTRPWDAHYYPLAQRGFFAFKNKVWPILAKQYPERR